MTRGFSRLLRVANQLRFEPHNIRDHVDQTGRYEIELAAEFPFVIKLFHYSSRQHTPGLTWHERLELFMPVDGPARVLMGDNEVELARGDLLVVDNLKLHRVVDFPGFNTRVIVVSFMPGFVYTLGSPLPDYAFLVPFYAKVEARPHILRASDELADQAYAAFAALLACYFGKRDRAYFEAGCKAYFLELLYHLARRFQASEVLKAEFLRQQQKAQRLRKLFDHVNQRYAERLTVREAAKLVSMSPAAFMKLFKQVAGMTFVVYVTRLRLGQSRTLLLETDLSIAEISGRVGFGEQSYFDRRFKEHFGLTPLQYRKTSGSDSRRASFAA